MNKQDLVAVMAQQSGLSKADTAKALNAFTETVGATIADGGTIQLVGFGTFKGNDQAARTARNPKTGEPVNVPAQRRVSFVAGKDLKDTVNKR